MPLDPSFPNYQRPACYRPFTYGNAEIRSRAQPIGISVTCSTGDEVVTGLCGTS